MKFYRTVIYEIEADTESEAEDAWGDDGPELASDGGVDTYESSSLETVPPVIPIWNTDADAWEI